MPIYALILAGRNGKLGAQLRRSSGDDCAPPLPGEPPSPSNRNLPPCGVTRGRGPGRLSAYSATMDQIAKILETPARRVVVNQTGLAGTFTLDLEFTPAQSRVGDPTTQVIESGVSLFTALEEQLGLKLEPRTGAVDLLIVERVERPTED